MMRAVLLGLLGAALAAGAAEAKACRLDHSVLQVVDTGERFPGVDVKQPQLISVKFRPTRFTKNLKPVVNQATGQNRLVGYDAVEMRGRAGRFILRRDYSIGSNSETAETWRVGQAPEGPAPKWVKTSKLPTVKPGETYSYVYTGDLAALSLKVIGCS